MKLSDLRPLINDGDWIMHREDCAWRYSHRVGMPCDCGADHISAALPALLRVAEAGKRYRSMCELFDKSLNRGDADTAYVNGMAAKRELFAALAALDEVQP